MKTTAIIGASPKPERYSYKAMKMLEEYGHKVHLVTPKTSPIEDHPVYASLQDVPEDLDTVTMYVGEKTSDQLVNDLISKSPKRVIFNPGSENRRLEAELKKRNIEVVHGCTLVMLRSGQF